MSEVLPTDDKSVQRGKSYKFYQETIQYGNKVCEHYRSECQARQEASTIFLAKVFNWMAAGLALTGIVAWFSATSGLTLSIARSPLYLFLIFAELGVVIYLSARIEKIQAATATALFIGYAALNGLTMSVIFLRYTGSSIAGTFMITAGMFGAMAVYGMVTKRDLSGMGSFMFMGLIGIIIARWLTCF